MAYIKINNKDYSAFCNTLKVENTVNYNAQTSAAGNTVVDYINSKRTVEVGIIPLTDANMIALQAELDKFNITLSFLNPRTNQLEEMICIIPSNGVEYYTIQAGKVLYKAITLTFVEL